MAGGIGVNNNPQIPHHALRPLGGVHDVDGLHIVNNNGIMGNNDPGRQLQLSLVDLLSGEPECLGS